ncbi:hypothetical protein BDQ17DRAFT_1252420, partial [Cyathus striatus]
FRIFINPTDKSDNTPNITFNESDMPHPREWKIWYTDGLCMNNGNLDVRAGAGLWNPHQEQENKAIRVPKYLPQSNNSGEAIGILCSLQKMPSTMDMESRSDSQISINMLTIHRKKLKTKTG